VAPDGCCCPQNLRWSAAEIFEFLAHEFAAILLIESKSDFDFPSEASQTFRCNQGVACVVALPSEHNALPRLREKFGDCLRDSDPDFGASAFD